MSINNNTWLRTIAGLSACVCLASAAQAQFSELTDPPAAPTDLAPASGTLEGHPGGLTMLNVVSWAQYFPSGPGPFLRPAATHFLVCVDAYVGASAPPCTVANADFTEIIAAPSSLLLRSGNRFGLASLRTITNTELNVPLRVSVVACSSLVDRSCRATGVDLYFSTRNPASDGASENQLSTATQWKFDARALNTTDALVPGFTGTIELLEVLGFGNPGRDCVRNVNDPALAVDPTLVVIGKDGSRTPITMVKRKNGLYDGPEVAGIFRLGSVSVAKSYTTLNPSFVRQELTSRGVGVVDFSIPASPVTQRTFVAIHTIDTGGAIREFNENDNVVAKCRKR